MFLFGAGEDVLVSDAIFGMFHSHVIGKVILSNTQLRRQIGHDWVFLGAWPKCAINVTAATEVEEDDEETDDDEEAGDDIIYNNNNNNKTK